MPLHSFDSMRLRFRGTDHQAVYDSHSFRREPALVSKATTTSERRRNGCLRHRSFPILVARKRSSPSCTLLLVHSEPTAGSKLSESFVHRGGAPSSRIERACTKP